MTARAIATVLAGLFLASCASTTPNMKAEAKARMEMGVTYLRQNDSPNAMKELTKASELDPDNPEIDMVLGMAYQGRGDFKQAEKYLRRAIDRMPDYADAHNNLGYLYSRQGRSEEAIREYEKAVANTLYQTPEIGYTNMAEEYRRLKNVGRAEEMYRRALTFNPRYVAAYRGLSGVQIETNRWADAAKTLGRCTEFGPDAWICWLDLGTVQVRLGKRRDALASFKRVLDGSGDAALRKKAAESINLLQGRSR